MGALQLLPGEREELRLRPAAVADLPRRVWAAGLVLWGGLLWTAFHADWWRSHTPSDWTAAWTWLWGTGPAAHLWTAGGILAGGAFACLPRGPWSRVKLAAGVAGIVGLVALLVPWAPEDALPLATMAAAVPALAWVEARRLSTTYHVTTLRLVVRTALPRRMEGSVLYSDLVDLDARPGLWPDTGTLIPVAAKGTADRPVAAAPLLPGVRPLRRVRGLVEALARRATASERARADPAVDAQVAEAIAALHRQ